LTIGSCEKYRAGSREAEAAKQMAAESCENREQGAVGKLRCSALCKMNLKASQKIKQNKRFVYSAF
jgi:hypothetical protein